MEGNAIGVLLFADEDGYLSQVEIYAVEGVSEGVPDPAHLTLYE